MNFIFQIASNALGKNNEPITDDYPYFKDASLEVAFDKVRAYVSDLFKQEYPELKSIAIERKYNDYSVATAEIILPSGVLNRRIKLNRYVEVAESKALIPLADGIAPIERIGLQKQDEEPQFKILETVEVRIHLANADKLKESTDSIPLYFKANEVIKLDEEQLVTIVHNHLIDYLKDKRKAAIINPTIPFNEDNHDDLDQFFTHTVQGWIESSIHEGQLSEYSIYYNDKEKDTQEMIYWFTVNFINKPLANVLDI